MIFIIVNVQTLVRDINEINDASDFLINDRFVTDRYGRSFIIFFQHFDRHLLIVPVTTDQMSKNISC